MFFFKDRKNKFLKTFNFIDCICYVIFLAIFLITPSYITNTFYTVAESLKKRLIHNRKH